MPKSENRLYVDRANRRALTRMDPSGKMTLRTYRPQKNGSMTKALNEAAKIAEWEYRESERPTGEEGEVRNHRGLVLMGERGLGKTHLLVGITRALSERGVPVFYRNAVELMAELNATYDDGKLSWVEVADKIAMHSVVVLDEVGQEKSTESTSEYWHVLVDSISRYRNTLVMATNLTGDGFANRYSDPMKDRLREMCRVMALKGESRRKGDGSEGWAG